jgi:ketosteroid isomerase-like protein
MFHENVEAIKRAYAALNRGDMRTVLGLCHPDVVFDNTNAAFDGVVHRGHEGLVEYFSLGREMWKSQRYEVQDAIPLDEDRVVVLQRTVSVGRDGVETIARNANVFTLKQGKATHIKAFQTKAEALEAVGLRE